MKPLAFVLLLAPAVLLPACGEGLGALNPEEPAAVTPAAQDPRPDDPALATATFGAGCYWCVEAVFQQVDGVESVVSGFMGGHVEDPTYQEVCSGKTGHAEVVQLRYDPARVSYETLLDWFFRLHDPTTKDRQGNDVGPQYRSVIFWHDEGQERAARAMIERLEAERRFPAPIVTEVARASEFYPANLSHQDYYAQNREQPYCRFVIAPKLEKLGLEH